jgi:hypothetical protein
MEVLGAVDSFTAEVWTPAGLVAHYVFILMRVASRRVCIAGITSSPDSGWMEQMARNMTMANTGLLTGCRYLLHDRDTKFTAVFDGILEVVDVSAVKLPQTSCVA